MTRPSPTVPGEIQGPWGSAMSVRAQPAGIGGGVKWWPQNAPSVIS